MLSPLEISYKVQCKKKQKNKNAVKIDNNAFTLIWSMGYSLSLAVL